jgi:hypothetical protein
MYWPTFYDLICGLEDQEGIHFRFYTPLKLFVALQGYKLIIHAY